MAVIKIVPMPGVKVTGATGPQGPIGLTGPAGADGLIPTSGTWDTQIQQYSGIVGGTTLSSESHLGSYYTVGDLVFIDVHFGIGNPTSWGNRAFGGLLPFKMSPSWQNGLPNAARRVVLKGLITLRGDAEPFGAPYSDDEFVSSEASVVLIRNPDDNSSDFFLIHVQDTNPDSINQNTDYLRQVSDSWPANLNVPNSNNSPYFSIRFSGVYRKA